MNTNTNISYEIAWRKSKDLLKAKVKRYNTGKKLGERLRSSHIKLAEYIIHLYNVHIQRYQVFGDLLPDTPLPALWVNNTQLANEMGVSPRTIQNLRSRLRTSGVISEETWHGTRSQYELNLSPEVLHVQRGGTDNLILYFYPPEGFDPSFFADMRKSLRHTVSSTSQDTSKLNKLSGAALSQSTDNQAIDKEKEVDNGVNKRGKQEKDCEKTPIGSTQDTNQGTQAGYETGRRPLETPPQVAPPPPDSMAEALEGIPEERKKLIERNVDVIWAAASANLYFRDWINDAERNRAKARLSEYFLYSSEKQIQRGANEIVGRIILVKKWIERGQAKGLKRYVPIPSIYFDWRNEKGFKRTKSWYKKHTEQVRSIKRKEILTKAINEYNKSLANNANPGPALAYKKLSARLYRHGGQEMVDEFNTIISQIQK